MRRVQVIAKQVVTREEQESCVMVLTRQPTASAALPLGRHAHFPSATTAALFPSAAHDALNLDGLLSPEERSVRDRVRTFMEREVAPVINAFWERAEFPFHLVPGIAALNIGGGLVREYGCQGMSLMCNAMVSCELTRVDASTTTFTGAHIHLAMATIHQLGSEEQKQELMYKMSRFELIGSWALTEPSNGSDASAIATTATKVPGGWQLNGFKRWIGNATFADIIVVWARNLETGAVNAFIVRKGNPGYSAEKMENKISQRVVQSGDITLDHCFVPDSDRLPNGTFEGVNKVLGVARVLAAWQPVGIAMGVFDVCARYVRERKQFGTHLGAFQLVQEKLARMLGAIQGMWLTCWRVTQLYEEGRMSHEQASLVKAYATLRGREVVALGRELLGGNGIQTDFHVAKAFCDMEAAHTYDGTYDVNALIAGRGITGISAFKARTPSASARTV